MTIVFRKVQKFYFVLEIIMEGSIADLNPHME